MGRSNMAVIKARLLFLGYCLFIFHLSPVSGKPNPIAPPHPTFGPIRCPSGWWRPPYCEHNNPWVDHDNYGGTFESNLHHINLSPLPHRKKLENSKNKLIPLIWPRWTAPPPYHFTDPWRCRCLPLYKG